MIIIQRKAARSVSILLTIPIIILLVRCARDADEVKVKWKLSNSLTRQVAPQFATQFQCVFIGVKATNITPTYSSSDSLGNYSASCLSFGKVSTVLPFAQANGTIMVKTGRSRTFSLYAISGLSASTDCTGQSVESLMGNYAPYIYKISEETVDLTSSTTVTLSNSFKNESTHTELTEGCSEVSPLVVTGAQTKDFGAITTTSSATSTTIVLSNTSNSSATITPLDIGPTPTFEYAASGSYPGGGTCGTTLGPGSTCSIIVQYSTSAATYRFGSIKLKFRVDGKEYIYRRRFKLTGTIGGSVDSDFSSGSLLCTSPGSTAPDVNDMVTTDDNWPVCVGTSSNLGVVRGFIVAANSSGSSTGKQNIELGAENSMSYSHALAAHFSSKENKLYIAGENNNGSSITLSLARFSPGTTQDFSLDTSFGPSTHPGTVFTSIGTGNTDHYVSLFLLPLVNSVEIFAGAIAGNTLLPTKRLGMAKFEASKGDLVSTFGASGIVYRTIGGGTSDNFVIDAMSMISDGRIVVVGHNESSDTSALLAIIKSDGTLDVSFNGGLGYKEVTSNPSEDLVSYSVQVARVGSSEQIFWGINRFGSSVQGSQIRALNLDGTTVTAFGTSGVVTLSLAGFNNYQAKGLLLTKNNRLTVAAKCASGASFNHTCLFTYQTDGTNELGQSYDVQTGTLDRLARLAESPQGGLYLAYNDTGNSVCLIRFK